MEGRGASEALPVFEKLLATDGFGGEKSHWKIAHVPVDDPIPMLIWAAIIRLSKLVSKQANK